MTPTLTLPTSYPLPPISGRLEPTVELCVYIKMWGGGREVRMPRLNKSREYDYWALEQWGIV